MKTAGRNPIINSADVHACQAAGMTQRQTAAKLGVSLSAVQYHWQRSKQMGRPAGGGQNTARITALILKGKTDREIAELLDIAVSTVNRRRRISHS